MGKVIGLIVVSVIKNQEAKRTKATFLSPTQNRTTVRAVFCKSNQSAPDRQCGAIIVEECKSSCHWLCGGLGHPMQSRGWQHPGWTCGDLRSR